METFGTIKNAVVAYMQRSTASDFNINSNIDILNLAINNARRWAERARNFHYSELDLFLSIGAAGSSIDSAYADNAVTAAGTLSPNVAGSFALTGTYNSLPFYTRTVSSVVYFLAYSGTAWNITAGGFTVGTDYWRLTTASLSPAGVYTAAGAYTGALTISQATGTVAIKTIQNVLLPVAGGDYFSVEFLLNNEWNERVSLLVGREHYNPAMTLSAMGPFTTNPICFMQGKNLYLTPSDSFTYPVTAKLSVVRWLADYTVDADTDFLIQRAPDFMMFQSLLEVNKFFKLDVDRQEGNLSEANLSANRDAAFSSLIAWDSSIAGGTTTPTEIQPA